MTDGNGKQLKIRALRPDVEVALKGEDGAETKAAMSQCGTGESCQATDGMDPPWSHPLVGSADHFHFVQGQSCPGARANEAEALRQPTSAASAEQSR